ncbi:hypothetical protein MMU07_17615 [Aquiflexum sp. LQ15W]|uniref:hypothetical protein n=1 Tax=Cognataquiflexum nitidum TaxID=2922272 RepID=UPI001F12D15C|nr:hypothetical protein [Cognataquiflexum nitidum]MCH6201404.1 hypothetical protein [Cognataquiflexum nitidum]
MDTLKEKIINIINHTEDDDLLDKIYRFLEDEVLDQDHSFSEKQIDSILKSKAQFENGRVKSQEEIENRFKEWVRK